MFFQSIFRSLKKILNICCFSLNNRIEFKYAWISRKRLHIVALHSKSWLNFIHSCEKFPFANHSIFSPIAFHLSKHKQKRDFVDVGHVFAFYFNNKKPTNRKQVADVGHVTDEHASALTCAWKSKPAKMPYHLRIITMWLIEHLILINYLE